MDSIDEVEAARTPGKTTEVTGYVQDVVQG